MLNLSYSRILEELSNWESRCLVGLGYILVAIVVIGIIGRYTPVGIAAEVTAPVEELSTLMLVWLAFWGASWAQRDDSHYKMQTLLDRFGKRTRLVCLMLGNLAVIGFLFLMVIESIHVLKLNAFQFSLVMGWPTNLVIFGFLTGLALMLMYTVHRVIMKMNEFRR